MPLELDLFAEMRALSASAAELAPEEILRMATINGARALGREKQIGELTAGAVADLIAIPFAGRKTDPWEAVLHHKGEVAASMISGKWVVEPETKQ